MAKTVVNIRINDDEGNVYSIRVEGKINNHKLQKIIQAYNTITSEQKPTEEPLTSNNAIQLDTFYSRLTTLIHQQFTNNEFSSDEARDAYEDIYNEPVKLATVSTYLSRLTRHGILNRSKHGRSWIYKLNINEQKTPNSLQLQ